MDPDIQRLLDKAEIEGAVHRWASGVGRKDWPRTRSVFHDEATDDHGTFDGGIDGFVEWQERHHQGIDQSAHVIGPVIVEFAGADLALSEAYVVAFQRWAGDGQAQSDMLEGLDFDRSTPKLVQIVGRYIDRFERRDGVWKISKRITVFDWIKIDEAPSEIPFQPNWIAGQRDKTDALYKMRAEMGLDR